MMMDGVYLLLGSNLGNRLENLHKAASLIELKAGSVVSVSSVYVTAAWGIEEQPEFYNQVLRIRTKLSPQSLLQVLLDIEQQMGRIRRVKWGERLIDIDILVYGDEVLEENDLTLPHPGIAERRFTLIPFCEIAPDLVHPVQQKTIRQLLADCPDPLEVRPVD